MADVCTNEGRKTIVDQTIAKFGKLNILVNNAGLYVQNAFENITEAEYDLTMNTNLKQMVFFTQLCLPHLIAEKGSNVQKLF